MEVLDMDMPSRIARWKRNRYEEDHEGTGDEERLDDATVLAEAYVWGIDVQTDEVAERAKPITPEWLMSIGFTDDLAPSYDEQGNCMFHDGAQTYSLGKQYGPNIDQRYGVSWHLSYGRSPNRVHIDHTTHSHGFYLDPSVEMNRGQMLDLIAGLGLGERGTAV